MRGKNSTRAVILARKLFALLGCGAVSSIKEELSVRLIDHLSPSLDGRWKESLCSFTQKKKKKKEAEKLQEKEAAGAPGDGAGRGWKKEGGDPKTVIRRRRKRL